MKKQQKKTRIIEITKQLIIREGYKKTTIQKITDELGIAKGTFYNYFQSKSELVITLILKKIEKVKEKNEKILKKENSIEGALNNYIKNIVILPFEDPEFFIIMMNLFRYKEELEKEVRELLSSLKEKRKNSIKIILNKYIDDLDIDIEEVERVSNLVICILIESYYENLFSPMVGEKKIYNLNEFKKLLLKIDIDYEVKFINKYILKLILK